MRQRYSNVAKVSLDYRIRGIEMELSGVSQAGIYNVIEQGMTGV